MSWDGEGMRGKSYRWMNLGTGMVMGLGAGSVMLVSVWSEETGSAEMACASGTFSPAPAVQSCGWPGPGLSLHGRDRPPGGWAWCGQDGRQGKNAVLGREGGDGCGDVLPVEVAERQAGPPMEVFEYGAKSAVFFIRRVNVITAVRGPSRWSGRFPPVLRWGGAVLRQGTAVPLP